MVVRAASNERGRRDRRQEQDRYHVTSERARRALGSSGEPSPGEAVRLLTEREAYAP